MRVSKNSEVPYVAGALAGSLRSGDETNLDVMGVSSTYKAVKALLLAQEFIKEDNISIVVKLSKRQTIIGDGLERTVIRFTAIPVKDMESDEQRE